MSQASSKELQKHNDEEGRTHDGALDAVLSLSARFRRPVDLDVSHNESSKCTSKVEPRSALSPGFRVGIKQVSADSCGSNNGCSVVHTPAHS